MFWLGVLIGASIVSIITGICFFNFMKNSMKGF